MCIGKELINPDKELTKQQRSYIVGCFRKYFRWYSEEYKGVYKRNLCKTKRGPKGGKLYYCECCGGTFNASKLEVDHIDDVIEIDKTIADYTIEELWWRVNCPIDNLQLLCKKKCHLEKSNRMRAMKASLRKYNKYYGEPISLYFVLEDGSVIQELKSEHKFIIVKHYKTLRGAVKLSNKIIKG